MLHSTCLVPLAYFFAVHLDHERRVVRVMGKGAKERIVPFGAPAARAIEAGFCDAAVVGGDGLWNCHIHTDDIGASIDGVYQSTADGKLLTGNPALVLLGKKVAPSVKFYLGAASKLVQEEAERRGIWRTLVDSGANTLPAGCGPSATSWRRCSQARLESKRIAGDDRSFRKITLKRFILKNLVNPVYLC